MLVWRSDTLTRAERYSVREGVATPADWRTVCCAIIFTLLLPNPGSQPQPSHAPHGVPQPGGAASGLESRDAVNGGTRHLQHEA